MSITVPKILLESPFFHVHLALAAFVNGEPLRDATLDDVLDQADWVAGKTEGYCEQAPGILGTRDLSLDKRRQLAAVAATFRDQVRAAVTAQREASERQDKEKRDLKEKYLRRLEEHGRREREERQRDRTVQEEQELGRVLERERAEKREQDRQRAALMWLDDPEGSKRAAGARVQTTYEEFPMMRDRRLEAGAWEEHESREILKMKKAEHGRQLRLRDEMVKSKAKPRTVTADVPAPGLAQPTDASAAASGKAILTPAKTTPGLVSVQTSAVGGKKHVLPVSTAAHSTAAMLSPGRDRWGLAAAPQPPSTAASASTSTPIKPEPSGSAPFRSITDVSRPLDSDTSRADPFAPMTAGPTAAAARPEIRTTADIELALSTAEATIVEHFEGLQDSAVALAIAHDDMRRRLVSVEQQQKAERVDKEREQGNLGMRLGKLEGRVRDAGLAGYQDREWDSEQARLDLRRQEVWDRLSLADVALKAYDRSAGEDGRARLERTATTLDERRKACGSVISQYAQRTNALEAGLKDIVATLEKRGMRLPQEGSAKRKRTT